MTCFSFVQEGSSHDRGLYARCFEELFDLSNSDTTSTSRFNFAVTVFELYNEQVCSCFSLTDYSPPLSVFHNFYVLALFLLNNASSIASLKCSDEDPFLVLVAKGVAPTNREWFS